MPGNAARHFGVAGLPSFTQADGSIIDQAFCPQIDGLAKRDIHRAILVFGRSNGPADRIFLRASPQSW
jgi:hypothetical protein